MNPETEVYTRRLTLAAEEYWKVVQAVAEEIRNSLVIPYCVANGLSYVPVMGSPAGFRFQDLTGVPVGRNVIPSVISELLSMDIPLQDHLDLGDLVRGFKCGDQA